jgi:DNA mismatch repair protein MSH3
MAGYRQWKRHKRPFRPQPAIFFADRSLSPIGGHGHALPRPLTRSPEYGLDLANLTILLVEPAARPGHNGVTAMVASSSSQLASQPKKQQSISSFFTPKTTTASSSKATVSSTQSPRPGISNGSGNRGNSRDGLLAGEGEGDSAPGSNRRVSAKRVLEDDEAVATSQGIPSSSKRHRRSDSAIHSVGEDEEDRSVLTLPSVGNRKSGQKISGRTSKYLFNSSPQSTANDGAADRADGAVDPLTQRQKDKLHQKFVKKLGRPDSMAEIKRRRRQNSETAEGDSDSMGNAEDEVDEGSATPGPRKGKGFKDARKGVAIKKGGSKLTPMEKQFLEIKRKHMDTILVMEVGYKFRFLGEDARTASKVLSIMCIPGKFRYDERRCFLLGCLYYPRYSNLIKDPSEAHIDRFASASIPVHRLHVHVKRLVAAGHKVGVVRQLETAALKAAGDNKNTPFVRKLTNLYTKGTYIDDIEGLEVPISGPSGGAPATGYLLCITETNAKGIGVDEKVHVGILAVQPATGEVIYDDFEDGFMRSEIETRLLHSTARPFLLV